MASQSLQLMWDVNAIPRFKSYSAMPQVNVFQSEDNCTKIMEFQRREVRNNTTCIACQRAS